MTSIFPVGNEHPCIFNTPNNDPATTICMSGASSQKYFSDATTSGTSCTSSRNTSVFPGNISSDDNADNPNNILSTFLSSENNVFTALFI